MLKIFAWCASFSTRMCGKACSLFAPRRPSFCKVTKSVNAATLMGSGSIYVYIRQVALRIQTPGLCDVKVLCFVTYVICLYSLSQACYMYNRKQSLTYPQLTAAKNKRRDLYTCTTYLITRVHHCYTNGTRPNLLLINPLICM